jgi:hypothetical protein
MRVRDLVNVGVLIDRLLDRWVLMMVMSIDIKKEGLQKSAGLRNVLALSAQKVDCNRMSFPN